MTTTTPATLPTYDRFIEPLLRFLAGRPEGAPAREAHEAAADALGLDAALARDGPPRDSGVLRRPGGPACQERRLHHHVGLHRSGAPVRPIRRKRALG